MPGNSSLTTSPGRGIHAEDLTSITDSAPRGLALIIESEAPGLAQPSSASVVRVRLVDAQTREVFVRGRVADDEKQRLRRAGLRDGGTTER